MALVEKKDNEALDRTTGRQRVERTFSLFGSNCEMLTLQVKREFGELDESATRRKAAELLYLSDKGALGSYIRISHRNHSGLDTWGGLTEWPQTSSARSRS